MYENLLSNLGLNKNEALLYEILLSQGPQSAKQLFGKGPLTRSNIYNVMEGLKKLNLITETLDKSRKIVFRAEPPAKLEKILADKEQAMSLSKAEFYAHLPTLEQMFLYTQDRPVIKYYEGYAGVTKIYNETLTDQPDEMWVIVSKYSFTIMDSFLHDYIIKRKELGIRTKIISSKPITSEMLIKDKDNNLERRFFETPFPTEINIFKNKVALLSYREKILGMIIEDKDYADAMRILFTTLWLAAKNPYLK